MPRSRVLFLAKLLVSLGLLGAVYWKLLSHDGSAELWRRLSSLSPRWLAFGFGMQAAAVGCSVLRWQRLLTGQGIHAPLRHLAGSFLIGRFFGELAPGGWTGLHGYRLYDIAKHTGKLARAAASIGIEMVLGWLSFGAVVVAGSLYGVRFIGVGGVLLVDAFFIALMALALSLVSRPRLFRALAERFPGTLARRLRTTTDAVCAYEGRGGLVVQAALLGVGTHVFRAFIYVSAARALHAELSVGEVFFGSALQVFATWLPASINGIGLREATAVALYTRGGVPESTAVLIPTVGFLLETVMSLLGGLVLLSRRADYAPAIRVERAEHEELTLAQLPTVQPVPQARWPRKLRGLSLGLGAGLLAGAAVGCVEALIVSRSGAGSPVLAYGALAYALCLAAIGAALGFSSALSGRLLQREAAAEPGAYARGAAFLVALSGLALGAFRLRRGVFQEQLVWLSPRGLAVLLGCALFSLLVAVALSFALERFTRSRAGAWLLRAWGTPVAVGALLLLLMAADRVGSGATAGARSAMRTQAARPAPAAASNILLVVVDTLRADHLPAYGYTRGRTPALERFAQDAIRFELAFANASWTRPSFASILSGRFAASHRTMSKADALPNEIVTLPEVLRDGGYRTLGVVTNFNIAPFFNFDQGFDRYLYLEPSFVLGANDTQAKLLLVQALRQSIESWRARRGRVEVGSAYQDAPTLNRAALSLLDEAAGAPWFMLAAYMDPHDPYYVHPYDGSGYSRAAHPRPAPSEAPELIRLYDGEITFWDEHFGVLLEALKQRGVYDQTLIVVTSDHGEEFMDHGGYWHGATLYDEALHVPLFVKLPGNRLGGSVLRHPVQSIDIMPSVLDAVGLSVPDAVQGQALWQPHESVLAEESHEGNVLRALRFTEQGRALKVIQANPENPRGLAPLELYEVEQDPHEQVNVAASAAERAEAALRALDEEQSDAARGRATQRSVDLLGDSTVIERLRALGYAGGDKGRAN